MAVLCYLSKLKRESGTGFGAYFLHDFFHKNIGYLILHQLSKFQYHTFFPYQDIKVNVSITSYLGN